MHYRFVTALFATLFATGMAANAEDPTPPYRAYDFRALATLLGPECLGRVGASFEEIRALDEYTNKTNDQYRSINRSLREGGSAFSPRAEPDPRVESLDRLLGRMPRLPLDILLYRGFEANYRADGLPRVGSEEIDRGYLSTSTRRSIALKFALAPPTPTSVLYVLYYGGEPGPAILVDAHEDEAILPRGSRMRIMAESPITRAYRYREYLVQLCAGDRCSKNIPHAVRKFWNSELETFFSEKDAFR